MRILIVEDNAVVANNLMQIIESFGYNNIKIAFNKEDALDELKTNTIDFVFLDIRLDIGMEGIEIAKFIYETLNIIFVYLTAFSDLNTMNNAIKYKPTGYITKPFKETDIYSQLKIAENIISNKQETFYKIEEKYKVTFIELNKLMYLKSDNHYIEFFTTDKNFIERNTMEKILLNLPSNFVRVHRSYIVNTDYINNIKIDELQYV